MQPTNPKEPCFIVLSPSLKDQAGHDYSYHKTVEACVQKARWTFFACISKECKLVLHKNWIRAFSPRTARFLRVFLDFSLVFRRFKKKKKNWFLESFSTKELVAFTLNAFLRTKRGAGLWLLFRYDLTQLPLGGKIHLFCAFLLRKKFGKNMFFLTDSELLKQHYMPFFSSVHVMPTAPITHIEPFLKVNKLPAKIVCWWPGGFRIQKGVKEIQYCAKIMHESRYTLRVPRAAKIELATYVPDVLSSKEYQSLMQQSGLVLLPYDPDIYKMSTSGILVEAIFAGKIPLVKEGSWLAYELRRFHLSELIIDFQQPDLLSLLDQIYLSSTIREKLQAMQASYVDFHSQDCYAKHVKELLGQSVNLVEGM